MKLFLVFSCVASLCDPSLIHQAQIPDLMICAPWAPDTFACLSNGIDHTPCCKARGLPDLCQQLCTGNVTVINFNHFRYIAFHKWVINNYVPSISNVISNCET